LFIRFPDELVDDLVLKKEHGNSQRQYQNRGREGDIKKYFLEEFQKFKKWLRKNTRQISNQG
jgi:hypothetical protein